MDRNTVKKIAGKIIPAISTTTSFVAGAIAVELLKVRSGFDSIERFRNCFANLSIPLVCFSEPGACAKYRAFGKEWTEWDAVVVTEEQARTIGDLIDYIEKKYNVEVSMINCGEKLLFMGFGAPVGACGGVHRRRRSRRRRKRPFSTESGRFAMWSRKRGRSTSS